MEQRILEKAKAHLVAGGYTCVLTDGAEIYTSTHRGVKPLVQFLESGKAFVGFSAADKVVGKAAAYLYVLLGVKEIYAQIISETAEKVLSAHPNVNQKGSPSKTSVVKAFFI